jgi:hypothetical protein
MAHPAAYINEASGKIIYPIEGGVWRHYKGGLYRVIGRARHHETGAWYVMYEDIGTGRMYMREEVQWEELVQVTARIGAGFATPRFRREGGE